MRNENLLAVYAIVCFVLSAAVIEAQQPKEAPPAPTPQQILAAKKIFIANAGSLDADIAKHYEISPDAAYNEFYAAMKSWGRYEIVSTPSDADLILAAGFSAPIPYNNIGVSWLSIQVRLRIVDPKTNIALWEASEGSSSFSKKRFLNQMTSLVNDMKTLAARSSVPAP